MDITILNPNFEAIGVIDTYRSFIWTDRYDEAGDFEIYLPMNVEFLNFIKKGYYLINSESEHIMIVETISIESDIEDGAYLTVTGRSLESILSRRIVWNKTIFETKSDGTEPNLQNGIEKLLNDNAIKPSVLARRISNLIFIPSDDPKITSLTFKGEYLGDDLYTIISKLCRENDIGFKIVLNDDNQFEFSLYAGVDNQYVTFSPSFDNIINTNYLDSDKNLKNIVLVVGETKYNSDGTEETREQVVLNIGNQMYSELERREIFTDATGLSKDDGYGGTLSATQYQARLKQRGIDTLMENTSTIAFEGEVDSLRLYKYGVDFFVGDIVQLANEYGHEGRAYISEFVIASDDTGTYTYPTFKTIQKGVYEE